MGRFKRFMFRAPIWLYRLRLGWMLGGRMLLLEHRGRTSGQWRRTVLEVVEESDDGSPVVVSGFGAHSQWCRNVLADPGVWITRRTTRSEAAARRLTEREAIAVFERYRVAHPRAARMLGSTIGVSLTEDLTVAARRLPVFQLGRRVEASAEAS